MSNSKLPGILPDSLDRFFDTLNEEGIEVLCVDRCLVRCPGEALHTTSNQITDCKVYDQDGPPFLHCFHSSCSDMRRETNRKLRSLHYEIEDAMKETEKKQWRKEMAAQAENRKKAKKRLLTLSKRLTEMHPWPYTKICEDSPMQIPEEPDLQWRIFLEGFFDLQDVIWIGRDKKDSGSPAHASRFRTVEDWSKQSAIPGVFVCPNTFAPGVYSRSVENIQERRYLVIESDSLSHDEVGSVFQYLQTPEIGLTLRAIVDTGRVSLHAYFNYPGEELTAEIKAGINHLQCCPGMFSPQQPSRLPGAIRSETGKLQRLIYLNP